MFRRRKAKALRLAEKKSVAEIEAALRETLGILGNPKIINRVKIEQQTKAALIEPLLRKLGYEVHDPRKVTPEYPVRNKDESNMPHRVDYALFEDDSEYPVALVEAKKKDRPLDGFYKQINGYYTWCGKINTIILTDGVRYLFFAIDPANVAVSGSEPKLAKEPYYTIDFEAMRNAPDLDSALRSTATVLYDLKKNGYAPDKYIHDKVLDAARENIITMLTQSPGKIVKSVREAVMCPTEAVGEYELLTMLQEILSPLAKK